MYHPGKVIEVFKPNEKGTISADNSTQAICEMWDDNILAFLVDKKLSPKIKPGDFVLVSYRPLKDFNPPVPEHVIIKILPKVQGEKIWEKYRDAYLAKKRKNAQQNEQSYIV
jgi:hypothetical protein